MNKYFYTSSLNRRLQKEIKLFFYHFIKMIQ